MPMESKSTPSTKKTDWLFAYIQRQWVLLSLLILYALFHSFFERKVTPFLEFFDASGYSFTLCIIIILIAFRYCTVLIERRYIVSESALSYTLVILLGWGYYRFKGIPNYEAAKTPIPPFYYIDFLLVICIYVAIVTGVSWYKNRRKEQVNSNQDVKGFCVDRHHTDRNNDLLDRHNEVEHLAEKIFQTDTSESAFTLGLTAPWGAGKTSFIEAMKKYLSESHNKDIILMDFNPWMFRKANNLTQTFFDELSRTLSPYSSALASGFIRYVDHILAKDNNTWIQLGGHLLSQSFNAQNRSEQYEILSHEITRLRRKIVIFIDDVDRLESEEIIELFSLVRNTSSFPHISYILVYDKEYVSSQLQNKFHKQTYHYMEKILQEEYPLAKITPEQLDKAFTDELKKLGANYTDLAKEVTSAINLGDHLPTIRSIKRICNTLSSRRRELDPNVNLFDWFILELIRIQYPRVFDLLRGNHERAFARHGDQYVMCTGKENTTLNQQPLSSHPRYGGIIYFDTYLSKYREDLQIECTGLVLELMIELWGPMRKVAPKQINHKDYIGIYFYGTLRASEIDENEFRDHILLPFEELKSYIQEKFKNGQCKDLSRKIKREEVDSQEKAEKVLLVSLYIGSHKITFTKLEISSLIRKLREQMNKTEQLGMKLKEIFHRDDILVGVLLYLSMLTMNVTTEDDSFPIPFDYRELIAIKENLFLKYVANKQTSNPISCYLLWRECRSYYYVDCEDEFGESYTEYYPTTQHKQMDKAMRTIIEKHIEDLIPYFIQRLESGYKLILPDPIWDLNKKDTNSLTKYFPDFISELDGSSSLVIKEFQDFLKSWLKRKEEMAQEPLEVEDEPPYIYFKFRYIQPAYTSSFLKVTDYR